MRPYIYVGRFDPRFLGVTIRATGKSDVHSFQYHDRSRHAPPGILEMLSENAVVSDVSRQTVIDHELRHFRDSLLFPFGAVTIRSRIHASYNGFQAAMTLKQLGVDANVLPVPLQQWLAMSTTERGAFLAAEASFAGGTLRPPPLPVIPADDDVSELAVGFMSLDADAETLLLGCRLALADYRLVESLWRSPHPPDEVLVSPAVDTWEAAGLMCQFAAIERYAGEPVMHRFINWVEQHGPQTYQRGLKMLNWCLEQLGWLPTIRHYLVLITWAQMGAYETDRVESSPGHRLGMLISAAKRGKRWSADWAFADLVAGWDAVVSSDSFAALRSANASFSNFCRNAAQNGMSAVLPSDLFSGLATTRDKMLASFFSDPDSYVDPAAYLGDESRYPLPCVGLEYQSGSLGSDWTDVTPDGWSPAVSFDTALHLTGLALLSDAVFLPGEKSLQPNGRLAIEAVLNLRAIRVIR